MRSAVRCVVLAGACALAAQSNHAQAPEQAPPQADAEMRKLDGMLGFVRNRQAQDYAVTGRDPIDEAKYVEVGGIEQWITIRGEDRRNPVLLFLHGGPGDATNPWGYAAFRSWLARFTVVQWDQRGSGRTLGRNGLASASTISIDRMTRDGIELTDSLRAALGKA